MSMVPVFIRLGNFTQIVAFTSNGGSFIDDALQSGVNYQYCVATVDLNGNENAVSDSIVVNTSNRNSVPDEQGGVEFQSEPAGLSVTRYGGSSLELFWERPENMNGVSFRVYRNGEFLATAPGNSFFDGDASQNEDWHYSVVTTRNTAAVSGVAFVTAPAQTSQCF